MRFNIILCTTLLLVGFSTGCAAAEKKRKKQDGAIRVHLEVTPDASATSSPVPIFRENPVMINVEKTPFLTESDVAEAKVINQIGGFSLFIKLTKRGSWLLENYTASNPGRRLAIFAQFGAEREHARWLAAPKVNARITTGTLSFAPDASREEAEEIALSLNNAARKFGNEPKNEE